MKPGIGKAILGGFLATVVMTPWMYFVPVALRTPLDMGAMLGRMLGGSWALGMLVHFVNGTVIFPAVYIRLLYEALPGAPWFKGTVWGAVLWLFAQSVVMPMMGGGFFSLGVGGIIVATASLVMHIVYGATLGALAGGAAEAAPDSTVRRAA